MSFKQHLAPLGDTIGMTAIGLISNLRGNFAFGGAGYKNGKTGISKRHQPITLMPNILTIPSIDTA